MGEGKRRDAAGRQRLPFDSLEEAWTLVGTMMLPPDAPPGAREAMRRFFMQGAAAFFDLLLHRMDPGQDPTSADLRRMDALYAEITAFRDEMRREGEARRAPPGETSH